MRGVVRAAMTAAAVGLLTASGISSAAADERAERVGGDAAPAAADVPERTDDCLADANVTVEPLVLLVRAAAVDSDEHPEAALVDRVGTRACGEVVERCARKERDGGAAAAVAVPRPRAKSRPTSRAVVSRFICIIPSLRQAWDSRRQWR